jgi:hypothetical protein
MLKNLKLKILIFLSRSMPKKYKKELIKRLVNRDSTFISWREDECKKIKNLYYSGMFYRAYDTFKTSIYAYLDYGEIPLHILLRSQLENIFYTNYFIKNPEDIKNSLKYEFYESKKRIEEWRKHMENEEYFRRYYKMLCDKTHPSSEGLKSCFDSMLVLTHEMEWKPILALKNHDAEMSDQDKEVAIKVIIDLYDKVIDNLNQILKVCPDYEIESYKETHKKSPEDYFKNTYEN